jgi:twitching motility protein PilI
MPQRKVNTMNPFETLLDIEQKCRAFAERIPRQIIAEKDWLGIGFRSSGLNFVCKMGVVSEILRWPDITAVPAGQPWFRGMTNLRGHLLSVTDLQGFVTGTVHTEKPLSRILVVSFEKASYGFAVDQVFGIEHFFGEEIKPAEGILNIKEYLPYLQGAFERDHQPWYILNFASIIQTPEFYHILSVRPEAVIG